MAGEAVCPYIPLVPKKTINPKSPVPLPSRDAILAFIARERAAENGAAAPAKIGKREIARAFGLKGTDKIGLKALLKELEAEGTVERRGKRLERAGVLPTVTVCDITGRDRDGDLIAVPCEWAVEADGEPPKIALHVPRKPKPGSPVPGVGDRALVRSEPNHDRGKGEPAYTGRVIKLLSRARAQVLGIYRAFPGGGGRILPIDKKNARSELGVAPGAEEGAQDGDLVAAELLREHHYGLPFAKVRERLGSIATEKAVSLIALHSHSIPHVFASETLAEAEAVKPVGLKGREDWRDLPLVTIDPPDAKDHDDAIHAAPDEDPANEGGFVLTVAIADVAAYVRPGRPLDREAVDRGNSVYFPDRVVPMLPERISNDLCSLRPREDRPALAVRMIIDRHGQKKRHTFHRIMMRSAAKLAYAQAQAAIEGMTDDTTDVLVDPVLKPLWAAYDALKIAREQRSPLDLDLPERKIVLKADGTVDRVVVPTRLDAHRLIEEFMILANVAAAETLEDKRQILVYRAHDEPSIEKLNALSEFLQTLGISLAKGQVLRPAQFNGILGRVRGTEHEHLVNEVVLRSQAQAEYTAENYGHFGLHLKRYAHFTSPIRRYADLIVHRALIRALGLGTDGLPDMDIGELNEVAARISAAERRAMAAERETIDRLIAHFLVDQVGATFQGRISGVTRAGLFIRLAETGADGFVPAATIGNDYYRFEEAHRALIGNRTGEAFRLGDQVKVKLVEAAPFAGALRFEILGGGATRRGIGAAKSHKGGRSPKSPKSFAKTGRGDTPSGAARQSPASRSRRTRRS